MLISKFLFRKDQKAVKLFKETEKNNPKLAKEFYWLIDISSICIMLSILAFSIHQVYQRYSIGIFLIIWLVHFLSLFIVLELALRNFLKKAGAQSP